MVEFEGVEEVVEFAVLLGFGEADKVLLQAVQGQLGLVVDVNLKGLSRSVIEPRRTYRLHEFLADGTNLLG